MNLDQQIKNYEDRINQLEQMKRALLSLSGNLSGNNVSEISENYLNRIKVDLDVNYQQVTILKIRKMMGF